MEMDMRNLHELHKTISEQLNARLSESPRFFGVITLVVTAYGYVLYTDKGDNGIIFEIVSVAAYWAILWGIWYLTALGYAFRYLQNSQHRIEDILGWNVFRNKRTGVPPIKIKGIGDLFWLLPGIYHAHLGGLVGLSAILFAVIIFKRWSCCVPATAVMCAAIVEVSWIIGWNYHYLDKYRREHVKPKDLIDGDLKGGQQPDDDDSN